MKEERESKWKNWKENLKAEGRLGLERLRRAALTGLAAGVGITLVWFLLMDNQNVRTLALSVIGAAVIIFILKIIYDFALEKLGVKKKLLANELFILFAALAFFGTTVCAFAPVLLFECVYDKAAERELQDYVEDGTIEELCVETENGALYGYFLHGASGSAPTVLYFGDSGEDAAGRVLSVMEDERMHTAFSGYNFVCVDYPGYGKSAGAASEKSIKRMALDVYDALTDRSDVSRIVLMGYGLGTGAANYAASERQPMGLILLAPYAEGYDLYNSYVNMFHGPLKALASFKMKSVKFADGVSVKPLLLASNADEIVPYDSAVRLFERYKNGCNFVTVDDIAHGEFWETQEVLDEIKKYLNK